ADDGIRDRNVTGVQTCALPIFGSGDAYISGALYGLLAHDFNCQKALEYGNATSAVKNTIPGDLPSCGLEEIDRIIKNHKNTGIRSEERRVGRGCRYRGTQ